MFCNILCTCAAVPTIKDGAKTTSKKASPKRPTPRKVGKPTSKRVVQTPKKVGTTLKKVVQKQITPKKRGPKGALQERRILQEDQHLLQTRLEVRFVEQP